MSTGNNVQNEHREPPETGKPSNADNPRRPRSRDLKETLIEAGLDLLRENGLALAADTISYAKVFAHLESTYGVRVTRASVHERIWANHDDFRRDVLASSLPHLPPLPLRSSPGALARLALTTTETSDLPDRITHLARVAGPLIYGRLLASPTQSKLQAVKAVASRSNDPLAAEMLHPLLQKRVVGNLAQVGAAFRVIAGQLRLKPRSDLKLSLTEAADLFHELLSTLVIGGLLDDQSGSQRLATPIDFGLIPKDAEHAWTPFSIGLASLLGMLFEADEALEAEIEPDDNVESTSEPEFEIDQTLVNARRRNRQELKQLVLAAGVELLLQSSLDLKPESLSYAAVFDRVKQDHGIVVNRGSVHNRIWSSHDDFRFEVLARALWKTGQPTKELARIFESAAPIRRDDGTIDRHLTALEILFSVGESQLDVATDSADYRQLFLIKAALAGRDDSPGATILRAAIQRADAHRLARYSRQMQTSILDLGLVIRPELGITTEQGRELFSLLATTSIAGLAFDRQAGIESISNPAELPREDGGAPDQWSTIGLILRANYEQLFVDPDR